MNVAESTFQRLTQSKSNEHYTPPWVFNYVRQLGAIALDPASNPVAQQWIRAETVYMLPVDGMQQEWRCSTGGMWLNPPYGMRNKAKGIYGASDWIEKAIASYDAGLIPWAVLLVRGDSQGVHELESRFASCEPGDRIKFVNALGIEQGNPPPGCRFWYLGKKPRKFGEVFKEVGAIRCPYFDVVPF
jgi:hypothetical protein